MRAFALALAALALLTAGCGGDDDGEAGPTTNANTELDAQLRKAVTANDVGEARRLLDEGANPNAPGANGDSALHLASSEVGPEPELLELLLENGADVNAKDSNNSTALIRAAQRGYPELVGPLLEAEAELDHVNDLSFTAVLATVIFGDGTDPYLDTVNLLVDAGADVTIPDLHGTPPRVHAELGGQTEVAGVLREAESS